MSIQRLKQPRCSRWDNDWEDSVPGARREDALGEMLTACIEKQHGLQVCHKWRQGSRQEAQDLHEEASVDPLAAPPHQVNVAWATGSQNREIALKHRALTADDDLRQSSLDPRIVTNERSHGEVRAALATRRVLHSPLGLREENIALPPFWNRQTAVSSMLILSTLLPSGTKLQQ